MIEKSIPRKFLETEEIFPKLLKNCESINDLANLSKTCRYFLSFFDNKRIKKDVDYNCDGKVEINIDFSKTDGNYFYSEPEHPGKGFSPRISKKDKCYDIDTLVYKNQLSIVVALPGLNFDSTRHDYKEVINNISLDEVIYEIKKAEVNIKNPVILDLNRCNGYVNHIILPYIISRYGNSTIQVIKMNLFCFFQKIDQEEILKEVDIFRGYKKLHELCIYENASLPIKNYTFDDDSMFIYILKCLSKKKNSILRIEIQKNGNIKLSFLSQTFKCAVNLNIKIRFLISIGSKKRGLLNWCEKIKILKSDLSKYITHIECFIQDETEFLHFIELLPALINLTRIKIVFDAFDIQDHLINKNSIEWNEVSLKELTKLTKVSIRIDHECLEYPDYTYSEICNIHNMFLKYLATILPSSIIFLELENILHITPQLCLLINKSMPNIQFLFARHIDFTNKKCLAAFQNLKYLQLHNCPLIDIPYNVEFLIHKYSTSCKASYFLGEDDGIDEENIRQRKKYSLLFSKEVCDITRNFRYYFNKLHKWDFYKNIIERYVVERKSPHNCF
uniref:F-box domain-containing protein n=1 Tax=Strongyloides stercoralis TaxID=6248 RepID=A0AAF5CQ32_STRER